MKIGTTIALRTQAIRHDLGNTIGRITGNRRLQTKSRRDRAKVSIKQTGAKIKDAFRH